MLTQEKIDKFYEDVKMLGLKKPGAAISSKTGDDKSNVSKYLNKKLEPSEEFIDRFYEHFGSSIKVVSRGKTSFHTQNHTLKSDIIPTVSDLLKEKDARIADAKEYADRFLRLIESNLTDISALQKEHYAYLLAAMQRAAERFAQNDSKILDDELNTISKYAADHMNEISQKRKGFPAKH